MFIWISLSFIYFFDDTFKLFYLPNYIFNCFSYYYINNVTFNWYKLIVIFFSPSVIVFINLLMKKKWQVIKKLWKKSNVTNFLLLSKVVIRKMTLLKYRPLRNYLTGCRKRSNEIFRSAWTPPRRAALARAPPRRRSSQLFGAAVQHAATDLTNKQLMPDLLRNE